MLLLAASLVSSIHGFIVHHSCNLAAALQRLTPSLIAPAAGHVNFNDEVTAGMRLADGVLLVVDAVEGVMLVTDKALKQAAAEGLPVCLLLSKVPRRPHASTGTSPCK